jgi:hypothetical protein
MLARDDGEMEEGMAADSSRRVSSEEKVVQRANRADRKAFRTILDNVPARPPLPGDELTPEGS